MTLRRTTKKKYWSCRKCGYRNERDIASRSSRKCRGCLEDTKPKPRVPKHAITLRDDPYTVYTEANARIHGVTDESCGVCGKPRAQERRHDRDHDHTTGLPRGLACGGNQGCNILMVKNLTTERCRLILAYLERVDADAQKKAA